MIPRWLANKRHETCVRCELMRTCCDKSTLLDEVPFCSLSKLHPLSDELRWAQAWPDSVPRASGCCDAVADGYGASH